MSAWCSIFTFAAFVLYGKFPQMPCDVKYSREIPSLVHFTGVGETWCTTQAAKTKQSAAGSNTESISIRDRMLPLFFSNTFLYFEISEKSIVQNGSKLIFYCLIRLDILSTYIAKTCTYGLLPTSSHDLKMRWLTLKVWLTLTIFLQLCIQIRFSSLLTSR